MSEGALILYNTEDGATTIRLHAVDGTVWLTQAQMADLFQTSSQAITQLIATIYADGEADEAATCKQLLQVRQEGSREVSRNLKHYNLDIILAVGYRVRSARGTQFRRWATTGKTAAELIESRGNPDALNMGLTSWKGSVVRKGDVGTAKNYLKAEEVEELNRIVAMYLDYAEDQARRRRPVTMAEWADKLNAFLSFNERDVLTHAGRLRMDVAQKLAAERFELFDASRRAAEATAADGADIAQREEMEKAGKRNNRGVRNA